MLLCEVELAPESVAILKRACKEFNMFMYAAQACRREHFRKTGATHESFRKRTRYLRDYLLRRHKRSITRNFAVFAIHQGFYTTRRYLPEYAFCVGPNEFKLGDNGIELNLRPYETLLVAADLNGYSSHRHPEYLDIRFRKQRQSDIVEFSAWTFSG